MCNGKFLHPTYLLKLLFGLSWLGSILGLELYYALGFG